MGESPKVWVGPPHPPFGMPPSERVRGLIGLVGVRFESPKGGKCSKKKHLVLKKSGLVRVICLKWVWVVFLVLF